MFTIKSDKKETSVSKLSFFSSLITPKIDHQKEMEKHAERCFGTKPKITEQQQRDDAFEVAMNISFQA